jgi:hypothetical protein
LGLNFFELKAAAAACGSGLKPQLVALAACQKTGTTINGASLRRIKGNGCLLSALGTLDRNLYALAHACGLRGGNGGETFVLRLLAGLATLRLVLETLVVKEDLLACCPDEIISAIHTLDGAILKLRFRLAPLTIRFARDLNLCHVGIPTDVRLDAWQKRRGPLPAVAPLIVNAGLRGGLRKTPTAIEQIYGWAGT